MPKSYASTIINAPADTVWSFVHHYDNLDEWLPSIETCEMEDGARADEVGAVRRLTAAGGDAVFRERLVSFDDEVARTPTSSCRARCRCTPAAPRSG